jgi:hypothetical protein
MPFSAGGSEIRPYRIRVVRWVGRATSPRRPLSRWELSSSCHVVLGGRLGDPPLPNPFCAMSWWGRISEAAVIPVGAQFCLPCRSRRAARRSAYRIHVVRWVGRAASNTSLQRHRKDGFDVIQQKLVLDRTGALVIEIESPGKEGNVVGTHFAPKCCTNSRHRTRATRCWQR